MSTIIRLGSAVGGWTFESGSSVETSASGIQSITVKALWPIADTVLSNIPAYGSSVSVIEPTGFIPSSFVLDRIAKGVGIEYLEGGIARVTFTFKRQDPSISTYRTVFVDTIINYKNSAGLPTTALGPDGQPVDSVFGFPEPVCTVKYSSTTQPVTSDGIHALPGSSRATDFPPVPTIGVPISFVVGPGAVVSYFDGTTFTSVGPVAVQTTFTFSENFVASPAGWQLIKLKVDPCCARSFFDVEEQWRNFYQFQNVSLVSIVPPPPPP